MVIILGFHLCTPEVAPKRLGFEEISSFPKFLEIEMGCSGIFSRACGIFFVFFGGFNPAGGRRGGCEAAASALEAARERGAAPAPRRVPLGHLRAMCQDFLDEVRQYEVSEL